MTSASFHHNFIEPRIDTNTHESEFKFYPQISRASAHKSLAKQDLSAVVVIPSGLTTLLGQAQ